MKILLLLVGLVVFLTSSLVSSETSSLPKCKGTNPDKWTNCFGTIIYENGSKYIGEWVQGRRNGNGTLILPNDRKIVGYFNDGIFGNGIYKLGNLKNIWDGISFWYYKVIE